MSLYRNYIDKQATLIKDNYYNNSKNPVWEIVRGQGVCSRYIFSFDISKLRNKLNTNSISSGSVSTFKVKFYNGISFRDDLIGKQNVDGFNRDTNIELQLFGFNEDFTNGTNFDYIYYTSNTASISTLTTQVPNWFYKDKINPWTNQGGYSATTDITIIDTNFIEQGNENLDFDVTSYIKNAVYNTTASTVNLGISYTDQYETAISGDSVYIISFFSKETQTFFEPFLETITDDLIIDNRLEFYLDQPNDLYLYVNKSLDSVDKIEIYDYNEELYTTILASGITKVNNSIYKINLTLYSADYPDMVNFTDKWYFTDNGISKTYDQEFTLFTKDIFSSEEDSFLNSTFYFSTYGILNNEYISQSEITRRVQVKTKRLFNSNIELNHLLSNMEYRMYVLQGTAQIEVIPFTKINKTYINNYFDLDIESLIPQKYFIEIRVNYNNMIIGNSKTISFNVASEK